jgi:hypothetical protein
VLTFITVTFNSRSVIGEAVTSVADHCRHIQHEHIVVDNASADGTASFVRHQFPWVRLVESRTNTGFARANNHGMALAAGDVICLMNPDIRLQETFDVELMHRVLARPDCGLLAAQLRYGDGLIQESLRTFPGIGVLLFRGFGIGRLFPRWPAYRRYLMADVDYHRPQMVDWAIGAFLIGRRAVVWDELGGFDEGYFMYYEDADLAWRLRGRGLRVYYEPSLVVTHLYKRESAARFISRLKIIHFLSILRFLRRTRHRDHRMRDADRPSS